MKFGIDKVVKRFDSLNLSKVKELMPQFSII